jgi:SAM-dependent methyltransferase
VLPKTKDDEYAHRSRKRQWEMTIIIEAITAFFKSRPDLTSDKIDILEFGSGDGFQIRYLQELGNVIASDIYTSDGVKHLKDIKFAECSIADAPFRNKQFDLIFSNQVIPDLEDLRSSFRELHRIGKSSCLYAFAVPTNIWLLLSVPAQYYNRTRYGVRTYNTDSRLIKFLRALLPEGRLNSNFFEYYRNCKIKNWQRLFADDGFNVIAVKPLLLYGPSEWPIIPTSACKTNFCSSVLFLMMKNQKA